MHGGCITLRCQASLGAMEQEVNKKETAGKRERKRRKKHCGGEIVGFSSINPSLSAVTAHGRKSELNIPGPEQRKSNKITVEKCVYLEYDF